MLRISISNILRKKEDKILMKKLINSLLLSALSFPLFAQKDAVSAVIQINAIKKDTAYLYAEATTAVWDDAYSNARALMETTIEDWVNQSYPNENIQGCIAKAGRSTLQIKTRRGNLYRAFLYVKKSEIVTFADAKDMIVVPVQQTTATVQPRPEEPKVETPVVVEQPNEYEPSAKEKRFLAVTDFLDIQPFIDGNEDIKTYGKYKKSPVSGDFYMFVFNPQGKVVAHLLFRQSKFRDVSTGSDADINDYKGCGGIWFKY